MYCLPSKFFGGLRKKNDFITHISHFATTLEMEDGQKRHFYLKIYDKASKTLSLREIFRDFQRHSETVRDFQRLSETFRDYQRLSETFRDSLDMKA
jgi:hypothetical protein